MEIEFIKRTIEHNEWGLYFFIAAWGIVAYNKNQFSVLFHNLSMVLVSDKYLKISEKKNNITHWFPLSMIIVQWLSLSFLLLLFLHHYGIIQHNDSRTYLQILNISSFFVVSRYLIEKIVAITFHLEPLSERINIIKLNYRNFLGLIYLSIATLLYYNTSLPDLVFDILAVLLLLLHALVYYQNIKWNQKTIKAHYVYFILYLCTFEIIPYLFLYKWFQFLGL